ncbi:MAG: hypothetical protein M1834_003649 [Cirrosporium novae-zelandiae]|nr:MAG: hypothetical protein M1834_003649 [Cirrosporium novae-zelandiae]
MADPMTALGVAKGVIELIPICADGINMIASLRTADHDVAEVMVRIRLNNGIFKVWKVSLGIMNLPPEVAFKMLKSRIPYWEHIGEEIFLALAGISDMLADINNLENSYKIHLSGISLKEGMCRASDQQDILRHSGVWKDQRKLQKRKYRMNLFKKGKFVLKDNKKLNDLAEKLNEYISYLMRLCPPPTDLSVYMAMFREILSGASNRGVGEHPHTIARAAQYLASKETKNLRQHNRYSLLANTASFRAKIQDVQLQSPILLASEDYKFGPASWTLRDTGQELGTMALRKSISRPLETRFCYVKWKSYRNHKAPMDHESHDIKDADVSRVRKPLSLLCLLKRPSSCIPPTFDLDTQTTPNQLDSRQHWFIEENLYQHPAKRMNPERCYEPNFDLYSLGCVFLELALWKPLSNLNATNVQDPAQFRNKLVGIAKRELPGRVGYIFAKAVTLCLEIQASQGKGKRAGTENLCWKVIRRLEQCKI